MSFGMNSLIIFRMFCNWWRYKSTCFSDSTKPTLTNTPVREMTKYFDNFFTLVKIKLIPGKTLKIPITPVKTDTQNFISALYINAHLMKHILKRLRNVLFYCGKLYFYISNHYITAGDVWWYISYSGALHKDTPHRYVFRALHWNTGTVFM